MRTRPEGRTPANVRGIVRGETTALSLLTKQMGPGEGREARKRGIARGRVELIRGFPSGLGLRTIG
jgi:hypothetical protein